MKVNIKLISKIIAIIAIIVSIIEGFIPIMLSDLKSSLIITGIAVIVLALFGLYGVYMSNKNPKASGIQYIITGACLFLATYNVSFGTLLFIIAGILILYHAISSDEKYESNKKHIIVPLLTIIVLILFYVIAGVIDYNETVSDKESIYLSNVTATKKTEFGYTDVYITGNLHTAKEFDSLDMEVTYYDANNITIDKSTGFYERNVKQGVYAFKSVYFEEDTVPYRAVIEIYNDFSSDTPIYTQEVTEFN